MKRMLSRIVIIVALGVAKGQAEQVTSVNVVGGDLSRLSQFAYIENSCTSSNEGGAEQLSFEVSKDALAKSPSWGRNDEYPPLSPRKALAAAEDLLGRLEPNPNEWLMKSVGLEPIKDVKDAWIYVVIYRHNKSNPNYGGLRILILMNGQPIIPRITSLKDPTKEIRQVAPRNNRPPAPVSQQAPERDRLKPAH